MHTVWSSRQPWRFCCGCFWTWIWSMGCSCNWNSIRNWCYGMMERVPETETVNFSVYPELDKKFVWKIQAEQDLFSVFSFHKMLYARARWLFFSKGGSLAKSRKLFFSGEVIFGGQNRRNTKKKFQKIILSQIVRQVIPIIYIPIKAACWFHVKTPKKDKNSHFVLILA